MITYGTSFGDDMIQWYHKTYISKFKPLGQAQGSEKS